MDELLKDSAFAEVVRVERGDTLTKLIVRVAEKTRWGKFVVSALRAANESGEFGVSIRKEYYLDDDGKPTFSWLVILWGDLEVGLRELQEVRAICEPKKMKALEAADTPVHTTGKVVTHIRSRITTGEDGDSRREIRTIPLKHVRTSDRNMPGRKGGFAERGIINTMTFKDDGGLGWSKESR